MARAAADVILGQSPDEIVRFATSWTDDMFMATAVLAGAARRTGEAKYADAVGRLLTTYVTRLQRRDRLFIHAESGPHAWGRGNGFAAFGLMEALTQLPSFVAGPPAGARQLPPADGRNAPSPGARWLVAPGGGRAGLLPRVHGHRHDRDGHGAGRAPRVVGPQLRRGREPRLAGGAGPHLGKRRPGGRLHRHGRRSARPPATTISTGRLSSAPTTAAGPWRSPPLSRCTP